ncbi:hypothetical protein [Roseateles sp. MS654]|uniref:hypothetical protein n=1 Tax=Roseateles sp. MS654 TaxID=3412685 RepID=UPI003C304634
MNKTPSALKWLAEKRARLAGDLQQSLLLAEELSQRISKLQHQLAAVDETIRIFDATLEPENIAPVAEWRQRYGRLGGFRDAVIDIVTKNSPAWVSSEHIELGLLARLDISFQSPAHRKRWRENSLRPALKRLLADGTLERRHDPEVKSGKHGYWRLKQAATVGLADL